MKGARHLMQRFVSRRKAFGVMLLLAGTATAYVHHWRTVHPKRLAEVISGRLYRCGRLTPTQLEFVHDHYHFRSIVSLIDPHHPSADKERDWAAANHVQWLSVPLPGDGATTPEQRALLKQLLIDEGAEPPILVHCAAGSSRTGVACALVRICGQGWTADTAIAEMEQFGFRSKHDRIRVMLRDEAVLFRKSESSRRPPVSIEVEPSPLSSE